MKSPKFITDLFVIISNAHQGQLYGDRPYIEHIFEVVEETKCILANRGISQNDPEYWFYVGVAYGHDVVEDTEVTLITLLESGMPVQIVGGIDGMTKRSKETRIAYINRLKFNKFSHLVKQADSLRNLTWSIREGVGKRIRKYTNYLSLLGNDDMYIVMGSPNPSRLRFVSNSGGGNYTMCNVSNNRQLFDSYKLEQVG